MLIQFSPQCSRRRHTRRVWELEPAFIIWPRIIAAAFAFADAAAAEVSSNLKFSARVPSAVRSRLTILALGKIDIHPVLCSANFSPRCFVNPASLPLPLTTSAGFTQPLGDKSALRCMCSREDVSPLRLILSCIREEISGDLVYPTTTQCRRA